MICRVFLPFLQSWANGAAEMPCREDLSKTGWDTRDKGMKGVSESRKGRWMDIGLTELIIRSDRLLQDGSNDAFQLARLAALNNNT